MTITSKEQLDGLQEAAKPLVKWLNENMHPHCKVIVTLTDAELVEGVAAVNITEFVQD